MDPVAGAFLATLLVFGALLGPGALVLAMIAWMAVGAGRQSRTTRDSALKRPVDSASGIDPLFAARFRQLEDGILNTNAAESEER